MSQLAKPLRVERLPRIAAVLLGAVLLVAGCTNLQAVRDFSSNAAKLTDYAEVTDRYVASADRQLAEVPDTPDDAAVRARLTALRQTTAAQRDSLIRLHKLSTGYMVALARLAGEQAYVVSGEVDQVSGAIAAIPELGISAEHVGAYASIASRITSWALAAKQARDVGDMVRTYGPAMDRVLDAMQVATASYHGVLAGEAQLTAGYQDALEAAWRRPLPGEVRQAETRRQMLLLLSRRSFAIVAAEQSAALAAAAKARDGIAIVRRGHADLLANVDRLDATQVVALLQKASADLRAVRADLDKLRTPDPS